MDLVTTYQYSHGAGPRRTITLCDECIAQDDADRPAVGHQIGKPHQGACERCREEN